jgi:hypothetical protein
VVVGARGTPILSEVRWVLSCVKVVVAYIELRILDVALGTAILALVVILQEIAVIADFTLIGPVIVADKAGIVALMASIVKMVSISCALAPSQEVSIDGV